MKTYDHVPAGEYVPTADQRIVLYNVTWDAFEAFLAARGESGPRVTYLKGTLELMGPSRDHENIKRRFAAVVDEYLDHLGIEYDGVGSWLLKSRPDEAGGEPDECYVLHDLRKDRWPDLAIEVVWTSGGIDKLEVYRRLGIGEVWFWIAGQVSIHVLTPAGYEPRPTSACVPGFDGSLVVELMDLPSLSAVRKALRARLG